MKANRKFIIKLLIFYSFLFFAAILSAETDKNPFPEWMENVGFKRETKHISFEEANGPKAPIDPETGRPSTITKTSSNFFRKPKLPDFTEMRKKAMKASIETNASSTNSLDEKINISVVNLERYKRSAAKFKKQLETAIDPRFIKRLESELERSERKIAIIEELQKLISSNTSSGTIELSKLSPQDQRKAKILQSQLISLNSPKLQPGKFDSKPTTENKKVKKKKVKIPSRFYRPGGYKSFYKESKGQYEDLSDEDDSDSDDEGNDEGEDNE